MQKSIYVDSLGHHVILARRKGTRNMRISIKSDGTVRLSIPYGLSEERAHKFLVEKSDWISKHAKPKVLIQNGAHIGKSHVIYFENSDIQTVKTRLMPNKIIIKIPHNINWDNELVQEKARKTSEKALMVESKHLLPQRLETLSRKHSIPYKKCEVKKLKSRWGSCDTHNVITLNIYLMQLDWSLIDYVILHELTHTIHKHHQKDFWDYLEKILPNYKERRKLLKTMPTDIKTTVF
jgi:predicted metal-dependent hydrolase